MSKYTVRYDPTTHRYTIDDGTHLLNVCPCCGKIFNTEAAARVVAEAIELIPIPWDLVMEIQQQWKKGEQK